MNFNQYAGEQRDRYVDFANTVAKILETTIRGSGNLRLQQIQSRAKQPSSLRGKLEKVGKLESDNIEDEIKDLAGCRVVFYTNSDVAAFLSSDILRVNFKIDLIRTKFHHPVPLATENPNLFISNNFVVEMSDARSALPEYERFSGLRCEIQVQTILNHAWSEMEHDIIYKKPPLDGFGGKLMSGIEDRMKRIMREYLIPAGYEFQKVVNDFERLSSGKALFDEGPINSILACKDNNELHEKLRQFKNHALPLYDDIRAVHPDIRSAILAAMKDGQVRERKPIETPFGSLDGFSADQTLDEAADILDELRYIDDNAVLQTFDVICALFDSATSDVQKKRLIDSARRLAEHSLDVWNQAGPVVQHLLVQRIRQLNLETLGPSMAIVLEILGQVLRPDVRGLSGTYNTITIKTGAVAPSSLLAEVRSLAIKILQEIFQVSKTDQEKRIVILKLSEADRTPQMGNYPNALAAITLDNSASIVEFYTTVSASQSYILLETIEYDCLWLYRRSRSLPPSMAGDPEIAAAQNRLIKAVLAYRSSVNADQKFVNFKALVGFQSVFPPAWEDDDFDIKAIDDYRKSELDRVVSLITEENQDEWFGFLSLCANTPTDDLATFPNFDNFLEQLGHQKAGIVFNYIEKLDDAFSNFLPAMLCGIEKSQLKEMAFGKIQEWISNSKYIRQLIIYFGRSAQLEFETLESAVVAAIKINDDLGVFYAIQISVARFSDEPVRMIECVFLPALRYLTAKGHHHWVNAVWPRSRAGGLFQNLTATQQDEVLDSMIGRQEVDYRVEELLNVIGETAPEKIIEFFGKRLKFEEAKHSTVRYNAIPYDFSQCEAVLQKVPDQVVSAVRNWFDSDKVLFTYRGGRLIKVVFPEPTDDVLAELHKLVEAGTQENFEFVVHVLSSYNGHPGTHPLYQEVINALAHDSPLLNEIANALDAEGVVTGEFGFVTSYLRKKSEIEPWQKDHRERVQQFAERRIISLDRLIADEQRRSEQDVELRKLAYGEG